jgi:hypothetical protein
MFKSRAAALFLFFLTGLTPVVRNSMTRRNLPETFSKN